MALIPSGFGQVNFVYEGAAVPTGAQVTLGFDHTENTGTVTEQAEAFALAWATHIMPITQEQASVVEVLVKQGPNDLGPSTSLAVNLPGGAQGVGESPQVAVLVQKITNVGGRQGRGRMYLPAVLGDVFDTSGVMTPSTVADYQAALNALLAELTAESLFPVVLHGPTSFLPPIRITDLLVSPRSATQRNRNRR